MAARGRLDLIQLDYARRKSAFAPSAVDADIPDFAPCFSEAVKTIGKSLYLEPDLKVITSAGWGSAYECVELTASALSAAGCGEIPVSAVRGSNLLPILDYLIRQRLDLTNIETGAPWSELPGSPVAADLQLGAGPLVTALEEGARVVVAGDYDGASPATAAAVHKFAWKWSDHAQLSAAACAARAAAWHVAHGIEPLSVGAVRSQGLPYTCVEIENSGQFTVETPESSRPGRSEDLSKWLTGKNAKSSHADVVCDATKIHATQSAPHRIKVAGAQGAPHNGHWRLDIWYRAGFESEVILEIAAGADRTFAIQVVEALKEVVLDPDNPREEITTQLLRANDGENRGDWLHAACSCESWESCRRFADVSTSLARTNPNMIRVVGSPPAVHVKFAHWPAQAPRGSVDIAVDTRPAKEWL